MKFFSEEGMESVVNSGPWMVNNKPFFVQKWDIHVKKSLNQDVNIQKEKPVNEFVVQEKTMERKDDIQSPIREGNNGMKKGSNSCCFFLQFN
ncbi:zinc knuckle CX2CX4HX4C containing protein [Tanacetum coccineum]